MGVIFDEALHALDERWGDRGSRVTAQLSAVGVRLARQQRVDQDIFELCGEQRRYVLIDRQAVVEPADHAHPAPTLGGVQRHRRLKLDGVA
ncbi:hypothetical protein D3C75_1055070 [compost metagenome]